MSKGELFRSALSPRCDRAGASSLNSNVFLSASCFSEFGHKTATIEKLQSDRQTKFDVFIVGYLLRNEYTYYIEEVCFFFALGLISGL